RSLAIVLFGAVLAVSPAAAQSSGDAKPNDQQKPADAKKSDAAREVDQLTEAARALNGPAANFECIWLGKRVVNLLSRDDLDTAFRHLDLYDRFGCPGAHIQQSFRCLLRVGIPDGKDGATTLNERIQSCWINPNMTAAAPAPAAAASAPTSGTGPR